MHFQILNLLLLLFLSHYYSLVCGQSLRNGNRESIEPEIDWEVARQNRITQQILQYYLERKLFPQLKRPSLPRVPTADEILAREKKNFNYDKIEHLLNATKRRDPETLQSVESERITSIYERGEGWKDSDIYEEGTVYFYYF